MFDETLQMLFNRKIKAEMVIYQEELKILRLRYSLLLEEELNNREEELTDTLEFKKEMKVTLSPTVSERLPVRVSPDLLKMFERERM